MRNRLWMAVVTGVAVTLAGAAAGARAEVVNIPWTELLPATSTAANPQPGPIANCRKARPKCVRVEIKRLRRTATGSVAITARFCHHVS